MPVVVRSDSACGNSLTRQHTPTERRGWADDRRRHARLRGGRPVAERKGRLSATDQTLGNQVTAYLAGLPDASTLAASLREEAGANVAERLSEAYAVVREIADTYDARTVQSWLFGTNSFLDDAAPIEVLRTADSAEVFRSVRAAAHAFAHPA